MEKLPNAPDESVEHTMLAPLASRDPASMSINSNGF